MAKQNNIDLKGQPQSLEAEQAVLGSMLTSKEAVAKALQWLKPHMFYKDAPVSYTHLTLPTICSV